MIQLFHKHNQGKSIKYKGFTLVELLIVMLILAVIAGIATPIYLNQKSRAQRSIAESAGRTMSLNLMSQLLEQTSFGTTNGTIAVTNNAPSPSTITITLGTGATSPAAFTELLTAGVTASGVTYANTIRWCLAVVKEGQTVIFTDAGFTNTQTSCGLTPGTNAEPPAVVTGGTLYVSGGYNYRVFTSSGTLTVTGGTLTADILVIGGGGAGGGDSRGLGGVAGGGGAGGVLYFPAQSLPITSYTATVGAGGTASSTVIVNGSSSRFGTLTIVGGGGGGANGGAASTRGVGASNGGHQDNTIVATNPTGQGYDGGGPGGFFAPGYPLGGGGGAGGLGGNGTSTSQGGVGGVGLNTWAAWATATSTGVGGYYGGGGAGGVIGTYIASGGAGGGGNTLVAGQANTGGGGGGTNNTSAIGANGGSGIVIVRYIG